MVKKEKKQNIPKDRPKQAEVIKTPDFKVTYSLGAFGGFSKYDFKLTFINESSTDDSGNRVVVTPVQVVMSHLAAKELAYWLSDRVKEFEDKTGKIKTHDTSKLVKKK